MDEQLLRPHDGGPDSHTAPHDATDASANPHHTQQDINDFFVPDPNPGTYDPPPRPQGSDSASDTAPAERMTTLPMSDHDDDPPTTAAFYHGHDYFAGADGTTAHPPQHDDYYSNYYDHGHQAGQELDTETPFHDSTQYATGAAAEPAPANYGAAFAQMAGDDDTADADADANHNHRGSQPRLSQDVFHNSSGMFGEMDDPSTKEAHFFYVEPSVRVAQMPAPRPDVAAMEAPMHSWSPHDAIDDDKSRKEPELPPAGAQDPFQITDPTPEEFPEVVKRVPAVSAPMAEESAPRPGRVIAVPPGTDVEDREAHDVPSSAQPEAASHPPVDSDREAPQPEELVAPAPQNEAPGEDAASSSSSAARRERSEKEEEEEQLEVPDQQVEQHEEPASWTPPPQDAERAAAAALLGETEEEAAVQERAAHIAALEERMRQRAHDLAVDMRQTEEEGGAGASAEEISEEEPAPPAEHEKAPTATSPPDAALPLSSVTNAAHPTTERSIADPAPHAELEEGAHDTSLPREAHDQEGVTVHLLPATHEDESLPQEEREPLREAPEPPLASDSDGDYQLTSGYHNAPEEHPAAEDQPARQGMFDDFYYSADEPEKHVHTPPQAEWHPHEHLEELQPVEHTAEVAEVAEPPVVEPAQEAVESEAEEAPPVQEEKAEEEVRPDSSPSDPSTPTRSPHAEEEAPQVHSQLPVADRDGNTLNGEAEAYVAMNEEDPQPTGATPAEDAHEEGDLLVKHDMPVAQKTAHGVEEDLHAETPHPFPSQAEPMSIDIPVDEVQDGPHVDESVRRALETQEQPPAEPVEAEAQQPEWEEQPGRKHSTHEEDLVEPPAEHVDPVVLEEAADGAPPVDSAGTPAAHEDHVPHEAVAAPPPQVLPVEQFIPSTEHDYTQGWSQGVPTADQHWDGAPPQEAPFDGPVAVQVAAVSSMPLAGEFTTEGEAVYSNQLTDGAVAPVPTNVATVSSMHLERHSSAEPMSGTGAQQPLYSDHLADQAAVPVSVDVTAVPSVPLASYGMPQPALPDVDVSHDGWGTGAPVLAVPPEVREQDIYVNAHTPAAAEVPQPPMEQFQEEVEEPLQRAEGREKRRPPQLAPVHNVPSAHEMATTYVPVTDVKVNSSYSSGDERNEKGEHDADAAQKQMEDDERRTVEVNSFVQKMRFQNATSHTKKLLNSIPAFSEETTEAMAATDNSNVSISDPNDGSFYPRHLSKLMPLYLYFSRNTYVQIIFFLLYLVVTIMAFVRLCGGGGQTCWFSFVIMLFYALDLGLLFAYQQRSRLRIPPFAFRLAEPIVLFLLFLSEMITWIVWGTKHTRTGAYVVFSFFSFVLWLVHGLTRLEQFVFGLRVLCSADRRRFQTDGFDLDLSYVHHNIIAMAWPADNFEKLFRNNVIEVADFLNRRHPQSYLVINLCSERTYNPTPFHHQTSWYPMDDHNPCELEMMVTFCHECSAFIGEDMYSRVLAIHCKGGKGRTGALICALMMYMGIKRDTKTALHHFARLRTKVGSNKFQGVQAPSQGRYVEYFEELIKLNNNNNVVLRGSPTVVGSANNKDALRIPHAQVRITRLRVMNLPHLWYSMGIGKLYFVLITKPNTERRVHFISNSDVQFSSKVPDPSSYTKKQLRDLFGSDEDNLYNACNVLDPNFSDENESGGGRHGYQLDNESFWFYLNNDWSRRLDYEAFHVAMRNQSMGAPPAGGNKNAQAVAEMNVSIEYKYPERIQALDGDVVLKFFYARNDPNPLEAPVQVWFHTAMEQRKQQGTHFSFARDDIDGPPKDKKFKRYPEGFSMEIVVD